MTETEHDCFIRAAIRMLPEESSDSVRAALDPFFSSEGVVLESLPEHRPVIGGLRFRTADYPPDPERDDDVTAAIVETVRTRMTALLSVTPIMAAYYTGNHTPTGKPVLHALGFRADMLSDSRQTEMFMWAVRAVVERGGFFGFWVPDVQG